MWAKLSAFAALFCCCASASAGFTLSTVSGLAVDRVDFSASFDGVPQKVGDYVEDGLHLNIANSNKSGFAEKNTAVLPGQHFGNQKKADFLRLYAPNDGYFSAVEFSLTQNFLSSSALGFFWEVIQDGEILDFGFAKLTDGTIAGFKYTQGFDELRLAAAYSAKSAPKGAPISIQDVIAQGWECPAPGSGSGSGASPVPEPTSLALLGSGLGLVSLRRRLRSRTAAKS